MPHTPVFPPRVWTHACGSVPTGDARAATTRCPSPGRRPPSHGNLRGPERRPRSGEKGPASNISSAPSPAIELLSSSKTRHFILRKTACTGRAAARRVPCARPPGAAGTARTRGRPAGSAGAARGGGGREREAMPPPDSSVINDPPVQEGAVTAARAGGESPAGRCDPTVPHPPAASTYKRRRGAGRAGTGRAEPLRAGTVSSSPGRGPRGPSGRGVG